MTKTLFTVHFTFGDTGQRGTYAIECEKPNEARDKAKAFYKPRPLIVGKVKASKVTK